jgi:ECF transporter S component (folate family)
MKKTNKALITTRVLVFAALFAALAAVLGQLLAFRPMEHMKFTLDKFILFLSGLFFGPLVGGMTGFVAEFAGGNLLGRGFTVWLCVPAVLYGVCGGLFRGMLKRSFTIPRLTIAYAIPTVVGAVLIQSFALAWTYNAASFWEALGTNLIFRSIQFTIMLVLEVSLIYYLIKSNVFSRIGLFEKQ